ncbi:MAG: hypothetical protein LBT62_04660 [Deltaproteobacteria bacterium]|jgi:hypothetical protein|nr:hypothetical protein [Deltaproteobacteria bacterium]
MAYLFRAYLVRAYLIMAISQDKGQLGLKSKKFFTAPKNGRKYDYNGMLWAITA